MGLNGKRNTKTKTEDRAFLSPTNAPAASFAETFPHCFSLHSLVYTERRHSLLQRIVYLCCLVG